MSATSSRLLSEKLLLLKQVVDRFPPGTVSIGAVTKWTSPKRTGPILESIRVGGRLFTSEEALQRFIAETDAEREAVCNLRAERRRKLLASLPASSSRGQRAAEKAGQALEKLGI